ncbi:biopolymer transporter ExbD [candidate division KSB1 bacterium]|nr:biopolymer transporter ExbD [candidate division KSB1 bacterium]
MRGGMIVRLIDVVFILLLGFINASDIIQKTQVPLPPLTKVGIPPEGERPLVLRISVKPTKEINEAEIQRINQRLQAKGKKAATTEEREKKTQKQMSEEYIKYVFQAGVGESAYEDSAFSIKALEGFFDLIQGMCRENNKKLMVSIIPDPNSMVQGTVNVFDICRNRRIEYTFRYYGKPTDG